MNLTTQNPPAAGEAAHSPIPGPFRADGNTVKAVSHGQWFTVLRCDNPRFTPEATQRMAAHVAFALNAYAANQQMIAELVGALEETINQLETIRRTKAGHYFSNEQTNMVSASLLQARAALATAKA